MSDSNFFSLRHFQIYSDPTEGCKPIDAIAQFLYKGYLVSMSKAGISKGACQTEVAVFDKDCETIIEKTHTVEEAIVYIDNLITGKIHDNKKTTN